MKQLRPSTQLFGETKPLSGPIAAAELIHQQMVLASSNKSHGASPPSIIPKGFLPRRDLHIFILFVLALSIFKKFLKLPA